MTADNNPKETPEEAVEILESDTETANESVSDDVPDAEPITIDAPAEPDAPDETPPPADDIAVTPPPPAAPRRRGGFFGPLLGGVLAAVIGFAGAQYLGPLNLPFVRDTTSALSEQLAAQDTRLAEMAQQLSALSNAPGDDSASAASVDALASAMQKANDRITAQLTGISSATSDVSSAVEALSARVSTLEKRPVAETPDLSGAVTAYEDELARLRTQVQALQNDAESATIAFAQQADQAAERVAAANANAAKLESRAGLMQIRAAIDSGAPFTDAVAAVTTVDVPKPLLNQAENGVPTRQALIDGFAAPAREALAASRRALAEGNAADRFGAFLQTQVGVRSTVPRDGDGPDAVLSRAEAALRSGDLTTALDEVATLPPEGQEAMKPWQQLVIKRRNALNAVKTLGDALAQN